MLGKTSDNKSIYYEIHGNVNARQTLVFLNGLSQSTVAWGFMIPFFASNYRIVLLDFIFQGESDKTGEVRDFDQHAQDVISILNTINIDKAIFIGLSYGSLVAQHLGVNHSERVDKLCLLSTFAHKTPYYEAIELSWRRALDFGGYSLMLDVMLPFVLSNSYFTHPIIPIEMLKAARKDLVDAASLNKLMDATHARKDYREQLRKIKAPSLVIHGRQDTLFTVDLGQAVADYIPNSKFVVIENAGHTLNLEEVKLVSETILNFIK
jgi:pimeloyl-ACP methyl ester carboxylesterase